MSKPAILRQSALVRARTYAALGALTLVAACSSSSDRFGSFDGGQATAGSGASVHTSSIPPQSVSVSAQRLDSPASTAPSAATYRSGEGSVVVAQGQTLYSIARTHNVKVGDLIAVNNLQPPYELRAGQTIRLPAHAGGSGPAVQVASSNAGVRAEPAGFSIHDVQQGETLYRISQTYGVQPAQLAAYNDIPPPYIVRAGQKVRVPTSNVRTAALTTSGGTMTDAGTVSQPARPAAAPAQPAPQADRVAAAEPKAAPPAPQAAEAQGGKSDKVAALPQPPKMTAAKFRWPVKGKVISSFGNKDNGARNDGINLSVPEGTSVRAAENGVVAYAGNELKGYGNLILIRHADNWVTAYGHNSELLVKRGDTVERGQIIAKAGSTGSVTSPQLHFEIRKGAQAVDPLKYLSPTHVAGG